MTIESDGDVGPIGTNHYPNTGVRLDVRNLMIQSLDFLQEIQLFMLKKAKYFKRYSNVNDRY